MDFLMDVDVSVPKVPSPAIIPDDEPDLLLAERFISKNPIRDGQLLHAPSLGLEITGLNTILPRPPLLPGYGNCTPPEQLSNAIPPRYLADKTQLASLYMPDLMMVDQYNLPHQIPLDLASLAPLQQLAETKLPPSFTALSSYSDCNVAPIPTFDLTMSMSDGVATIPQLLPVAPDQDEASMSNPRRLNHPRPSREDWTKYKSEIKRLYLEEKNTLSEVMDIMKEKHNFRATVKMYKSRFSEWGYVKNNKESDIRAMIKMKTQCEAVGKRPEFSVSGLPYDIRRMQTYIRRKKKNDQSILGVHGTKDECLASYITCEMASMGPSVLRSPDVHRRLEAIMTAGRSYINHSFGPENFSRLEIKIMGAEGHFSEAYGEAHLVYKMLDSGQFQQGGRLIRRIAMKIERMLQSQQVFLFMEILWVAGFLSRWPELVVKLIQCAIRLSQEYIKTPQHPLRVFLTQLVSCGGPELTTTVTTASACYMDALTHVFGEGSTLVLNSWSLFATSSGFTSMMARSFRAAETGLQRLIDEFGACHEYTLEYMYQIAWFEYDKAEFLGTGMDTAKWRFEQLLEHARDGDEESWWWRKQAAESALSEIHEYWLHDLDAAEGHQRAAISALHQNYSNYTETIADGYFHLRRLLQKQGKHEQANEISQLLVDMFPPDDVEVELLATLSANTVEEPGYSNL